MFSAFGGSNVVSLVRFWHHSGQWLFASHTVHERGYFGNSGFEFKAGQVKTTTVDPDAGSGNSTIPSPASGNGTESGNGSANSTANGESTIPVLPSDNGTSSKRAVASRGSIANEKRAAVSIDSCVNVTGAINITGGMVGTLKPLFSASQTYEVFSTSSLLTQKCFGTGTPPLVKARAISGGSPAARAYALVHRRPDVEHVSRHPSVERRKAPASNRPNEIKPQQSKGSKSSLSCGIAGGLPSADPLSVLTNLLILTADVSVAISWCLSLNLTQILIRFLVLCIKGREGCCFIGQEAY
ncbi:hypothetical protein JB92DRAFT_2922039 [Gautieria morchelliformis]|nr:hypothetical protein JB92DRAFT_2922039 [Gautieria morchelliformis]